MFYRLCLDTYMIYGTQSTMLFYSKVRFIHLYRQASTQARAKRNAPYFLFELTDIKHLAAKKANRSNKHIDDFFFITKSNAACRSLYFNFRHFRTFLWCLHYMKKSLCLEESGKPLRADKRVWQNLGRPRNKHSWNHKIFELSVSFYNAIIIASIRVI